jgi:hypothetical protein
MVSIMKNVKEYKAPSVEMYDVLTEQGFCLSGGSTVEQVGGRTEEESWE